MADNDNSSSVGMVVVVGIIVLILIVGFFLYRWGGFSGGTADSGPDLNIEANLPGGNEATGGEATGGQ